MDKRFRSRFFGSSSSPNRKSKIQNRKLDVLGKGESIFKGALDLGEERGCQTSEPFEQTPFIHGFDLFSHGLGRKRETSNALGYERMTRREMSRVLGQWNDHYELA